MVEQETKVVPEFVCGLFRPPGLGVDVRIIPLVGGGGSPPKKKKGGGSMSFFFFWGFEVGGGRKWVGFGGGGKGAGKGGPPRVQSL